MTEVSHNSPRPYLATVPPAESKAEPLDYPQSTLSFKLRLGDVEMSWTLRGDDADVAQRLPRALATIRQLQAKGSLPAPAEAASSPATAAAPQPPLEERPDWCSIHGISMRQQANAQGSWWSHRLPEGGFCKGKRKRAGA
jgi:hypothetical protein